MALVSLDASTLAHLTQKLDRLTKSFAAGTPGLEAAGRTGVAALADDQIDDVLRSIAIEEKDFLLTKDIPTISMKGTTYSYRNKTSIGSPGGLDLAGTEGYLPQEDSAQYGRVAEVAKTYGIRTSITHLAQLTSDNGLYALDLMQELDHNAALALGRAFEVDFYYGGDYYINFQGDIDYSVPLSSNNSTVCRQLRGIQSNVREGNSSVRGIPGDFIGFGSNRSVVHNRKGGVLDRTVLDNVVMSVTDNGNHIDEGHCTSGHLTEFRQTFLPTERSNISDIYAIKGADVNIERRRGLEIETIAGPVAFLPNRFKYLQQRPIPVVGSSGPAPVTPSVAYAAGTVNTKSGMIAGETYYYTVQAVNISGKSSGSTPTLVTVTTDNAMNTLTITNAVGVEYYNVYRTDKSDATAGKEMFIGKAVQSLGGTTVFGDNNRLVPGLDSILFCPKSKNRAKMGNIGAMVHKLELGRQGLGMQYAYASYVACICDVPRNFALLDGVFQNRAVLANDEIN